MLSDIAVPKLNVHTAEFTPLPDYGGSEAILYRSPDSTRLAGIFRESGSHTLTLEFDEFIFVVAGGVAVTVHGGERHEMTVGDAFYLRQGMTLDFEITDDFQGVTVLISDKPINY
jgi:uncharacterized cupin superfamily protein